MYRLCAKYSVLFHWVNILKLLRFSAKFDFQDVDNKIRLTYRVTGKVLFGKQINNLWLLCANVRLCQPWKNNIKEELTHIWTSGAKMASINRRIIVVHFWGREVEYSYRNPTQQLANNIFKKSCAFIACASAPIKTVYEIWFFNLLMSLPIQQGSVSLLCHMNSYVRSHQCSVC